MAMRVLFVDVDVVGLFRLLGLFEFSLLSFLGGMNEDNSMISFTQLIHYDQIVQSIGNTLLMV